MLFFALVLILVLLRAGTTASPVGKSRQLIMVKAVVYVLTLESLGHRILRTVQSYVMVLQILALQAFSFAYVLLVFF
jgi:hypothetical protein